MGEVFYNHASELATVSNTFTVDGVATDPTAVSFIVTDPDGATTTYTYAAAQITKVSTGLYRKDIPCTSTNPGRWQAVIVGTGAASDVTVVTWNTVATGQTNLYASLEDLRAIRRVATDNTDDDGLYLRALAAASRRIDTRTGRRFYLDTTATARVYGLAGRTTAGGVLLVDDIGSATGLVVEGGAATTDSWSATTAYLTGPHNALAVGRPITALSANLGYWAGPHVRVTARWGWPTIPDEIAQATLLLANRLIMRKDSPEGVVASGEWGAIRMSRWDPDVEALIEAYVLPGFA